MKKEAQSTTERRRVRIFVGGRVQGVAFRFNTVRAAERLSVNGWVRNCYDGTVEILAEGAPEDVEALIEWCRIGPPGSRVTSLDHRDEVANPPLSGFEVRY